MNRALVDFDHEPNGIQWPRCTECGHRTSYAGSSPTATRRIIVRHPGYLLTELMARHVAKNMTSTPARL